MYSMKEVCEITNLTYQTLKFYCNEGLIPNVKRDETNYRVFNDDDLNWIKSITCLKKCNFSIKEIKEYLDFCLQGKKSIQKRQVMLAEHKIDLLKKIDELNGALAYIEKKLALYEDVLAGKIEYFSYVLKKKEDDSYEEQCD